MGTSPEWGLRVRMVASVLLLLAVTASFLGAIWWVLHLVVYIIAGPEQATFLATLVTALVTVLIVYLEFSQRQSVAGRTDTRTVTREEYPELYKMTTKVARMYEVPVPTIVLSGQTAPEALVVGYRPGNTQLILSEGTLQTLTGEQLEAVIAHELAHVANRDAMVMTAVSLPAMLADGLRSRLFGMLASFGSEQVNPNSGRTAPRQTRTSRRAGGWSLSVGRGHFAIRMLAFVIIILTKVVLITIATVAWILSRTIIAVLSRSREKAADRAAAEVLGSPATLATALTELDETIDDTPGHDLRESAEVSSMSILPLEPPRVEPIGLGPDGEQKPFLWSVRGPIRRWKKQLFRTHPKTHKRLDQLATLEQQNQ